MTLKTGVAIERGEDVCLYYKDKQVKVAEEDVFILDRLLGSYNDDEELIRFVAEYENASSIEAGFRLAQFVEDYGYFIAEPPEQHMILV